MCTLDLFVHKRIRIRYVFTQFAHSVDVPALPTIRTLHRTLILNRFDDCVRLEQIQRGLS